MNLQMTYSIKVAKQHNKIQHYINVKLRSKHLGQGTNVAVAINPKRIGNNIQAKVEESLRTWLWVTMERVGTKIPMVHIYTLYLN